MENSNNKKDFLNKKRPRNNSNFKQGSKEKKTFFNKEKQETPRNFSNGNFKKNSNFNSFNKNKSGYSKNNNYRNNKNGYNGSNQDTKIGSLLEQSLDLHSAAKKIYDKYSLPFNLEKNAFKNSEFKWINKMIEKGTYEDKLSAYAQHIKKAPKQTLTYLTEIVGYLSKKNTRHTLITYEALKDIFLNSVLENRKYMNFIDYITYYQNQQKNEENKNNSQNIPDEVLLEAYITDKIHKLYFNFISSLETYIKEDNIMSIKKQILNILLELLKKKPEREEYILDLLIYKLGDPKFEISNQVITLLKNLQETHIKMSLVILKRLHHFINNSSVSTENGSYHALCLISQFKMHVNEEFIKNGLEMFFKLFNEYINFEEDRYFKFMEQIIKSISYFYKCALLIKNNESTEFKKYFEEKVNLLFMLSHSKSMKLRIQVLRLIYILASDSTFKNIKKRKIIKKTEDGKKQEEIQTIEDSNNSLLDRYYKALYEVISLKEVLVSKNIKDYLKLVMNSLMSDSNTTRLVNLIKRLLQSTFLAEPQVICCVLIIVSHVINKNKSLWPYIETLKFNNNSTKFEIKDKSTGSSFLDNSNKRDPQFVLENSLIELNMLKSHFHPTIQKWTKEIIEDHSKSVIEYNGDPIMDFSLVNFLHKFITKNPRMKNQKKKLNKDNKDEKEDEEKVDDEEDAEVETGEQADFINKFSRVNKEETTSIIKKKKKGKKGDIEEYADKVVEDYIDKINTGNDHEFSEDENLGDDDDVDFEEDEGLDEEDEDDFDGDSQLQVAELSEGSDSEF